MALRRRDLQDVVSRGNEGEAVAAGIEGVDPPLAVGSRAAADHGVGIDVRADAVVAQDRGTQTGSCVEQLDGGAVDRSAGEGIEDDTERVDQRGVGRAVAAVDAVDIVSVHGTGFDHRESAVIGDAGCRSGLEVADEDAGIGAAFGKLQYLGVPCLRVGYRNPDALCDVFVEVLIQVGDPDENRLPCVEGAVRDQRHRRGEVDGDLAADRYRCRQHAQGAGIVQEAGGRNRQAGRPGDAGCVLEKFDLRCRPCDDFYRYRGRERWKLQRTEGGAVDDAVPVTGAKARLRQQGDGKKHRPQCREPDDFAYIRTQLCGKPRHGCAAAMPVPAKGAGKPPGPKAGESAAEIFDPVQ